MKVTFVSAIKTGESITNILKLLFFTISLHCIKSNQISTYRKLNFSLTRSIYFVFLPLEMEKRLEQTKLYHSFSYVFLKETTHKLLKVAATKILFSVCILLVQFASMNVFYAMCGITFRKSLSLL